MRADPLCMPFECFKGILFENGRRYAKSANTIQKGQNASKCLLRNGTDRKKTSSHIILDPSNAFGFSRTIFCRKQWGKGGILDHVLFWAPGHFTGPNWDIAQLDRIFYKIRP